MQISKEAYQKRCLELARLFGSKAEAYECIDSAMVDFFEIVGYVKVCELLIVNELNKPRSQRAIARQYGMSRQQVERINSKRKARTPDR